MMCSKFEVGSVNLYLDVAQQAGIAILHEDVRASVDSPSDPYSWCGAIEQENAVEAV